MIRGSSVQDSFDITLPECGEVVSVNREYLDLRVMPLSEEERKRYWNKAVIEFEGEVTLAELAIRKLLEGQGFDAVWATGPNRFTKTWPSSPVLLQQAAKHWYERIASAAMELNSRTFKESKGGCWDIVACRDELVLFFESKRRGKDAINDYQRGWLEAARNEGLPLSAFSIVEWG